MKLKTIELHTSWNVNCIYKLVEFEQASFLVVEFPGANYGVDKPIFHYTRKALLNLGMDVLSLEYGYQAARQKLNFTDETIEHIINDLQKLFNQIELTKYKVIIFVSKSLGTLLAGKLADRLKLKVHQLFITPIKEAIPFVVDESCVITGTHDPLFTESEREQISTKNIELHVIPNADHGLETKQIGESIEIMKNLQEIINGYIRKLTGEVDDTYNL